VRGKGYFGEFLSLAINLELPERLSSRHARDIAHDQLHQEDYLQQIDAEDLEISDVGFFNIENFAYIAQKGAFYLSRLRSDVKVYQQTSHGLAEFDVVRFVKKLHVNQTEVEVYLKKAT
jgi:hypothetical protein